MKYEELKFIEINAEEVEIIRYSNDETISKITGIRFGKEQIEKLVIDGNVYLRDCEEIEIDWLGDRLEDYMEFYDEISSELIKCVAFRNEQGEMVYGFSDHND